MFLYWSSFCKVSSCSVDDTHRKKHSQKVVARRCSVKKVFLEISQNSLENTNSRVSFLMRLRPATLLKKRLWHRFIPMNLAKFLRTPFLTEYLVTASDCFWLYFKLKQNFQKKCIYWQKSVLCDIQFFIHSLFKHQ